jgi:UDP-N-acetylglucosamine acyltransferase
MSSHSSSLSFIHPDAIIGSEVDILPFCYVDKGVVIGDRCHIGPNATILSGTTLGKNCRIFPGAVVGAIPQDLKYSGEDTSLIVCDNTTIREFVTLNKGTRETGLTYIGENCLIMAYSHVAHDCHLGNRVILSNAVQLAGHVHIEDDAILGGNVLVQQFCKIGRLSFIGGAGLVRNNVPPFVRVAREPLSYIGVNKVGMARKGFQPAEMDEIKELYDLLFVRNRSLRKGLDAIKDSLPASLLKNEVISFVANSNSMISGLRAHSISRENENNS